MPSAVLREKELYFSSVSVLLYQLFFFSGVKLTGIAVGTILMLGSSTVFAGILSVLILSEKPERKWYPASFLSVAGCFILIAGGGLELDAWGALFAVLSGLSYSLFSVFVKKILAYYPPLPVTAAVFTISSFLAVPVLFYHPPVWIFSLRGIAIAAYLGLFATAIAYFLYTGGLKYIYASTAVTLSLAEPATASILGIFFIGEKLTLYSISGIIIIFSGLVILSLPQRRVEDNY